MTELEQLRAENRIFRGYLERFSGIPSIKENLAASPETAREVERVRALENVFKEAHIVLNEFGSGLRQSNRFAALNSAVDAAEELDVIEKEKP